MTAGPELARVEWRRDLPCRRGAFAFVALIRDANDPPRRKGGKASGDIAPHLTLRKTRAPEWAERIAAHLSDGVPRTFNRIAVELVDKTADVVFSTPMHDAIWLLVELGRVEYTPRAPIFFRAVKP